MPETKRSNRDFHHRDGDGDGDGDGDDDENLRWEKTKFEVSSPTQTGFILERCP